MTTLRRPVKVIAGHWFGMKAVIEVYDETLHVRAYDKDHRLWECDIQLDDETWRLAQGAQPMKARSYGDVHP